MKKKGIPLYDAIFAVFMIAILFFFIWKCPFGYGGCDEPFYLTLAQRLSMGDAPLADEWNLAQLSGILLLPLYRLHQLITGSAEGIVLHFRYIYTAAQCLVTLLLYIRLRRYRYGALAAAAVFAIYTPYDIMALSYNTIALMAMALCLTLLATSPSDGRISCALSGVCFGVAVLANPYIIMLYLLYLLALIAALAIKALVRTEKGRAICSALLRPRRLCFFTLGAAVPAVIFLLIVFSRAGIDTIIANLRALLNDPEHAARSIKEVIYSFFYVMRTTFGSYLAVWFVLTVLALFDYRKRKHAWMYFCMTALVCAVSVMIRIPAMQSDYNYIMFPITMCGLTAYLLTQKKNHRIFVCLWCLGMLYAFCLGWASNQGDNAICMGMPVAAVGSVLLIYDFVRESLSRASGSLSQTSGALSQAFGASDSTSRFTAPLVICVSLLLLFAQLGTQCYAKSVHAFWEPSVAALDTKITEGPLAGVYTTKEHAEAYNTLLSEIRAYRSGSTEPVLFVSSSPWCYLYASRPYGVYSSWISTFSASEGAGIELLLDRLGDYYRMHPDRIPADIYIAKNDIWYDRLSGADGWESGYPLAAWLLTATNIDPSPLYPPGCAEWDILYSVTETAHGFHLSRIDAP